jgi:acetyl-CoA C-acetyltransferase
VNKKIYIVDASRTAVGSLGKSLKDSSAVELGSSVINNSIKRCKIKSSEVDEVIMGQVLTGASGQNPARQASINAGLPKEIPAYIVNQVCGSGLRSVASGFQSIKSGDSKIIIAGGQENMSLAPHAIHLRDGKKLGDTELIDTMIKDGLWDAFHGYHMGLLQKMLLKNFKLLEKNKINLL